MLEPAKVCFGARCVSWAEAWRASHTSEWLSAPKPPASAAETSCEERQHAWNCGHNAELFSHNSSMRDEVFDMRHATRSFAQLRADALDFVEPSNASGRQKLASHWRSDLRAADSASIQVGWVPPLIKGAIVLNGMFRCKPTMHCTRLGEKLWRLGGRPAPWYSFLPCSSARGEDAVALRSFFTDFHSGLPIRGGTFLEIGALDGRDTSNTWALERCLGWRGVLIEALPHNFDRLIRNRPRSINLRTAACADFTTVNFTQSHDGKTSSVESIVAAPLPGDDDAAARQRQAEKLRNCPTCGTISSECGPLGAYLGILGVQRIDLAFVDVEGAEYEVLQSLEDVALGVVVIEVRGDGARPKLAKLLLSRGLHFVGTLYARGTVANAIADDVYCNFTHMERFFPTSRGAHARPRE